MRHEHWRIGMDEDWQADSAGMGLPISLASPIDILGSVRGLVAFLLFGFVSVVSVI